MSDPLLRELDHYVVLEPGGNEAILSAADTLSWLATHLASLHEPPDDLAEIEDPEARARRLLDTACELELAPGMAIQWFAVRLEPPSRESVLPDPSPQDPTAPHQQDPGPEPRALP
jgi:hypothetical protein